MARDHEYLAAWPDNTTTQIRRMVVLYMGVHHQKVCSMPHASWSVLSCALLRLAPCLVHVALVILLFLALLGPDRNSCIYRSCCSHTLQLTRIHLYDSLTIVVAGSLLAWIHTP